MAKKEKPAITRELSLKEYILVFKYIMKNLKAPHATGFVNAPLLYGKPSDAEIEALANSAIKHDVLVRNGNETNINPVIATFINSWIHSSNVVGIKKISYADQKGIYVARDNGMFLVAFQDVQKDKITLLADTNLGLIYDYLAEEIERKDVNRGFKLKKVNKELADKGRQFQLSVSPINQVILQTINNRSGQAYNKNELINIDKKDLEIVKLDAAQKICAVEKKDAASLKQTIIEYISSNCPDTPVSTTTGKASNSGSKVKKSDDPEFYTRMSFRSLTGNEKFPKGFLGFLKMMFVNFFKSFFSLKNFLQRLGLMLLMSFLALVWNLYALCYLNDTFNIGWKAVFGKATPYLLAGVAERENVIGIPKFMGNLNTIAITVILYYLLSIAIRSLISDIARKKVKSNIHHLFTFNQNLNNYGKASSRGIGYFLWVGLIFAAILNPVLFNPFTVLLLALMLFFSCTKAEEGALAPTLMYFLSCVKYKRVMEGKSKAPLFGELELRLFGISVGLIFFTVINAILWFTLDFNFWVRVIVSVVVIILALMRIGVINISKPAKAAIFGFVLVGASVAIFTAIPGLLALADDGGWSESGGTLAGLMNNYGWPTVLGFSLTLAAAVAFGCFTAGLGTAVILGAAGTTFGVSALGAIFTETGREAAYDFIWGNRSPYGGDSTLAKILSLGVSFVPVFGDVFGVVTGVRDVTYDISTGDWGSLLTDAFGLVLDVHGVAGDFDEIAEFFGKNADDLASVVAKNGDDIASVLTRNGDELASVLGKNTADTISSIAHNSDEIISSVIKNGDEAVETMIKHGDEAVESMIKHGDEAVETMIKNGDEVVDDMIKKGDKVVDDMIKKGDEAVDDMIKKGDEVVDNIIKSGDEAIEKTKLDAIKENIENIRKVDPAQAEKETTQAIKDFGKDAGLDDELVEKYIKKIEGDHSWDVTKKAKSAWDEDTWNSFTDAQRESLIKAAENDKNMLNAAVKDKEGGLDTLFELKKRYDEGYYDKSISLDEILKKKLDKSALPKSYAGIDNSEYLPRVDDFVSDNAVLDYVKRLAPDNEGIGKCTNLQELANELKNNPTEIELVSFQNGASGASNIYNPKFKGNYGNIDEKLVDGGGVFCVPASTLQDYAVKYPDFCKFDGSNFTITNPKEFGDKVLSGVPLSKTGGTIMIRTKVPLDGKHISMPSVNSGSAYMNQFVPGGKLLSGETEVCQNAIPDIVGNAVPSGPEHFIGNVGDVSFTIDILH